MKQYTWVPTGFSASLTGAGVSGTLVKSDRAICQGFVDYVVDKRFVTDPVRVEISDHVLTSAQRVREYAVQAAHLPRSSMARLAIKNVAAACRDYVRAASPDVDQETLNVALLALRKRIGSELVALTTKYSLDCDYDLSDYREDAVEILESWMRKEPYEAH